MMRGRKEAGGGLGSEEMRLEEGRKKKRIGREGRRTKEDEESFKKRARED